MLIKKTIDCLSSHLSTCTKSDPNPSNIPDTPAISWVEAGHTNVCHSHHGHTFPTVGPSRSGSLGTNRFVTELSHLVRVYVVVGLAFESVALKAALTVCLTSAKTILLLKSERLCSMSLKMHDHLEGWYSGRASL